ncbi:hypothetical protein HF295_05915 [Hujiaoplasma nucleasis]|uniref:Uncharacterized protein n=1 Tax=Hujiaoplasma nucleasis TaxID=2725268 RepID=A0A7L6N776_9MOLU|nr:hypothetical protein [Hujiaoplasma nucleasis]QLY40409.1 hypothetical protein HF295_05915 [Hujiaoplasma nucleasis]
MNERLKEYQSWYLENKDFYDHLESHNSILYTRFKPVYEVLLFLFQEYKDQDSLDDDIDKIIQVGLEYLYQQFFTCNIYLEKFFNHDFHHFMHYDTLINYLLFIEDLRYELAEQKIQFDEEEMENLLEELEEIITEKKDIPDNYNVYIDSRLLDVIQEKQYEFHSIIDIFVDIALTLGLDLDEEEDEIVIGKEI